MNIPKISVIMAFYQGDNLNHLKEAINSIIKQDYENFELIISIDGEIDQNKLEYLYDIALLNKFVSILHNKNRSGPSFARNLAISKANGDYIAIMDSDDISESFRLRHQLDYLTINNLDIISSNLIIINMEGKISGIRNVPSDIKSIKNIAPFRCPMHNPSAFGKTEIFQKFRYNENLMVSEDYDLWIRLLLEGFHLGNMKEPVVRYRQSKNTIKKRTGLKYAYSDFLVKLKALKLAPWHMKIFAAITSIGASIIRLLPPNYFFIIYNLHSNLKK